MAARRQARFRIAKALMYGKTEYIFGAMLMVVFGAGASFDSFAEYPPLEPGAFAAVGSNYASVQAIRPPLAADLFQERFADIFPNYKECLGLFPQLRWAAGSIGIEKRLAELVDEAQGDPRIRQQMLALRFYIKEAIASTATHWKSATHGADNYAVLLDRIDHWRRRVNQQVALVTFNYDILLDNAARTVLPGWQKALGTIPDYIARPEYKVLKLHGSTDWLRIVPGLVHRQGPYPDAMEFAFKQPLPMVDSFATDLAPQPGLELGVPAIAIPVQEKSDFELPLSHQAILKKCIEATTDLIIIGWRGMEKHFLRFWNVLPPDPYPPLGPPHLKHVLIVDKGQGSQGVEAQLQAEALMDWDRISLEMLSDGFSAFLRGDRLEAFLLQVLGGVPQV